MYKFRGTTCCHDCCVAICLTISMLVILLLVISNPIYKHELREEPVEVEYFDSGKTVSLQFNPHIAHNVGNHSLDVCNSPYEFACQIEETPIPDLIFENNLKLLDKVIHKQLKSVNFMEKCALFHKNDLLTKRKLLLNTTLFKEYVHLIENSNMENLEHIFSLLHDKGIREPFRLLLLPTGEYEFSQSQMMKQMHYDTVIDFVKLFKGNHAKVEENYEVISKNINIEHLRYNIRNVKEVKDGTHFPLDYYLPLDQNILIDESMLLNFMSNLQRFTIDQWKDYLYVIVSKSILHQFRLLENSNENICQFQMIDYFPLSVCRKFKVNMDYTDDIDLFVKNLLIDLKGLMIETNYFALDLQTMNTLKSRLEKLDVYINKCAIKSTNESISEIETVYFNGKQKDYPEIIFNLISERNFQERRHKDFDVYYRELLYNYLQWNAWYYTQPEMLVIPPGFLDHPMNILKYNSCQYHSILGNVIMHEFGHFIHDVIGNSNSYKFERFSNELKQRYGFPNALVHKENIADNIGFLISYYSWNKIYRTEEEKKCYFLTFIRLFCPSKVSKDELDTDHAAKKSRAIYTIQMWKDEFKKTFNC